MERKCPMKFANTQLGHTPLCIKEDCSWWCSDDNECAIKKIAGELVFISEGVDTL